MPDSNFIPVNGVVQSVRSISDECCQLMVAIVNENGLQNFVVSPETYVIGEVKLRPGMTVTAFYDASLPVPLIFPPQYHAVIIGRRNRNEMMSAGYFNNGMLEGNETIQLNISRATETVNSNGQQYNCSLEGRLLIVYYSTTTRSIPPQTTPRKIIVMC